MSDKGRTATLVLLCLFVALILPCSVPAATLESEVSRFVKQMYGGNDIEITFASLPHQAKGEVRVKTLGFTKVPDSNGDGICLAGIEEKTGAEASVYVPFKVLVKKKLYVARHHLAKGDAIHLADLDEKESFLNGVGADYPSAVEEIVGKTAKKEIPAGEIVTSRLLECAMAVQKGEVVSMRAENNRLVVQGKGTALEKGKVGDLVRVKSPSGKEVIGKVTGNDTVAVEF
ncbi:MAG: flagellar basal body P-ring formation chaperone FlgA [Syntrophorhabdales bacterium]|jgi:flagella basal body P-ring formation protein FlgA